MQEEPRHGHGTTRREGASFHPQDFHPPPLPLCLFFISFSLSVSTASPHRTSFLRALVLTLAGVACKEKQERTKDIHDVRALSMRLFGRSGLQRKKKQVCVAGFRLEWHSQGGAPESTLTCEATQLTDPLPITTARTWQEREATSLDVQALASPSKSIHPCMHRDGWT